MSEVEEEIELAEVAFSDYRHMENLSLRRRYVTLYFSLYHAARALMVSMDYLPETHSGLDSLVHNILVRKEEILTEEEAGTFSKLKTRREQADYETEFYGSEEELESLEEEAENLLEKLKQKVENRS